MPSCHFGLRIARVRKHLYPAILGAWNEKNKLGGCGNFNGTTINFFLLTL